jgi:hypothetical protein
VSNSSISLYTGYDITILRETTTSTFCMVYQSNKLLQIINIQGSHQITVGPILETKR